MIEVLQQKKYFKRLKHEQRLFIEPRIPPKAVEQVNIAQQQEVVSKPIVEPAQEVKIYFAEYRITGSIEQLRSVSKGGF